MRESPNDRDSQGHFVAWALALVFLGLVAAPALLSKHPAHEPGIVDVGTPGAAVTAVPPSAAVSEEDTPLSEWADHTARGRDAQHHDVEPAPKLDEQNPAGVQPAM